MTDVGLQFNYKQQFKFILICCTALMIPSFPFDEIKTNSPAYFMYFVFSQRALSHIHLISFIILLKNLYERYAVLNRHLRYSYINLPIQFKLQSSFKLQNPFSYFLDLENDFHMAVK